MRRRGHPRTHCQFDYKSTQRAIVVGVAVWATRYALRASQSVIVTLSLMARSAI